MSSSDFVTSLFDAFTRQNILIIGDVMVDSYLWGKVDRISPEAPVPVVSLKSRESRLGGAANVALNIQSLGANPVLCSVIGKDDKSHVFYELMQKQNLDISGIITCQNRVTTTKFRIIGNNVQMLRVDDETEKPLDKEESALLAGRIQSICDRMKIGAIIFEDYDKGVITPWLINQVVQLAGERNIPVVVDPKKKNFMNYKGVTLFKPNLKELREGLKLDDELEETEKITEAVQQLQNILDVEISIATLSEKGICYSYRMKNGTFHTGIIPAHVRDIADVSGAGDTVISTLALCMAAGTTVEDMARLSNLAGGLVCEYVGVVPVNRDQLFQEALKTFG
jgi:D-glycero-beta-D-manno-heptose-7-phosphate kinase